MTKERKNEIKERLLGLYDGYEPSEFEKDNTIISMFELVSRYNHKYNNAEGIGGRWIRENIPELKDL